jgi:hypothetical protein
MLSCRDVTRLISESMDGSLPLRERVGVRLHLLICAFCARYRRQLLRIRETARRIADPTGAPGGPGSDGLSPEARDRIRKALASS